MNTLNIRDCSTQTGKIARILGIDPDSARLNPEPNLFEGPNTEALSKQRGRIKKELAECEARRQASRKAESNQSQMQNIPTQPRSDSA